MLKLLVRTRLEALLRIFTGSMRSKKAQSKLSMAAFTALMLLSLGSLGTLLGHVFHTLVTPFRLLGLGWLYFALAAILAFAFMLIGNVFAAKAQLFEARDNDLLLSMPIRPFTILLSRLFLLLVLALVFETVVAVPAYLSWRGPLRGWGLVSFLAVFVLMLPLLNISVSSLLGWLLHLVSARARHKSLVTVLLTLAFLSAYLVLSFRLNTLLAKLSTDPTPLAGSLGAVTPLVWLGRAIAAGEAQYLPALLLPVLLLAGLCLWLLSHFFLQTATDHRDVGPKRQYVERTAKLRSPSRALLQNEFRRLWASPAYLFNCGLGCLFVLLSGVALLVKGQSLTEIPGYFMMRSKIQMLALPALCFMPTTIFLTAPSVSLEGRSLWLPKSLPVNPWLILQAKLRLHMILALPPLLFTSVITAVTLQYHGAQLVLILALPTLYGVLMGLLGLFENLRRPNFDWINETQAVKSSISVLTTMFLGMASVLLPVLLYLLLKSRVSWEIVGFAVLALVVLVCLLLWRWLRQKGVERFEQL